MALPSTGSISMSQVRGEIGLTGAISLNTSQVRTLAGKASGTISMGDLRGKAWGGHYINTSNRTEASIYALMGSPTQPGTYIFENQATISAGIGSYALRTGVFPAGSTLHIINKSTIQGRGGNGGVYDAAGDAGSSAIYVDFPCALDNGAGYIYGGGGGGGAARLAFSRNNFLRSGGGGGAGSSAGTAGDTTAKGIGTQITSHATAGTVSVGGAGGLTEIVSSSAYAQGGQGGGVGSAGSSGSASNGTANFSPYSQVGGAAGAAITKNGHVVTITAGNNTTRIKGAVA